MIFYLDSFEGQFNEKTLKKGLQLFKSKDTHFIKETEKIKLSHKHTTIEISIKRSGNKLKANCSCKNMTCEHIAAVLFFLNKDKFSLTTKSGKSFLEPVKSKTAIKTECTIPELLSHLDQKQLVQILNEISSKDENINIKLRASFATLKNHTAHELLTLKIQNALFNNNDTERESKLNTKLLIQTIFKFRIQFKDSTVIQFYVDSALIIFSIFLKSKKHWLKELIEMFCDEAFTKITINELKSTGFNLTELINNYELKLKPDKDRLLSRFYIRCLWASDINLIQKRITAYESSFVKQKQLWPEAKLNITLLHFIQFYKRNTIKNISEIEQERKLAATIALFELEPKKAELLLLQLLNISPNAIFGNYSISYRIYQLLKYNSSDSTLKTFLLTSFRTECRFSEEYLLEFDKLSKNDKQKVFDITSIIDFWLSLNNSAFIIPLLELALRYDLTELIHKILKTNLVPYVSFKNLLVSKDSPPFRDVENLFIESILRKVNHSNSIRSLESIYYELEELLTHLNIANPKLFYKKLYTQRLLNNHFFKLIEKELELT